MESKAARSEQEPASPRELLERISDLSSQLGPKGVAKAYQGAIGEMLAKEPSLERFAKSARPPKKMQVPQSSKGTPLTGE